MSPRKKRFTVIGLALLCVLAASAWLAWSPAMLWLAKRDAAKKYADMQDAEALNVALAPDVRQINDIAGSGEQERIAAVVDGYRFSLPAARYQRLPGQYVDFDSGKLTVRCLGVLDLTGEFAKAATDDSAVGQYLAKTDPFQILVDAFNARPKDIEQQASIEALKKHLVLLLIKAVLMPVGADKHWERFDTGKCPGIIAGDTSMRGIMVTVYLPEHKKFADILIRPKGETTMAEVYRTICELDVVQGEDLPPAEQRAIDHLGYPPRATITVGCPGLSAEEVEQLVAAPLSRSSKAVSGIREVRSCSSAGTSTIEITCETGMDSLALARRAAQDGAKALPSGVSDPVVTPVVDPCLLAATIDIAGDVDKKILGQAAYRLESIVNETCPDATAIVLGVTRELSVHLDSERAEKLGLQAQPMATSAPQSQPVFLAQGQQSVLVKVYAPNPENLHRVRTRVLSAAEQLRQVIGQGVQVHVVPWSGVFLLVAEPMEMPADEIAARLAVPVANDLSAIEGVDWVHATSSTDALRFRLEIADGTAIEKVMGAAARLTSRPGMAIAQPELFPTGFVAQIDLHGVALDDLQALATRLRQELISIPGVARINAPGLRPNKPTMQVRVNREKVAALGITVAGVTDILKTSVQDGATPQQVEALTVPTPQGNVVALREVVEFVLVSEPPIRCSFNGSPCITMSIAAQPGHDVKRVASGIAEAVDVFRREHSQISVQFTSYVKRGATSSSAPPTAPAGSSEASPG
jgi:hypothetical protein